MVHRSSGTYASRNTLHRWLNRYREGGVAALADRSKRPAGCSHQIAAEVEAKICDIRRPHPDWGPTRLKFDLARSGVEPVSGRIDDHSRFCVAARLVKYGNTKAVCSTFSQAMQQYGVPEQILTDTVESSLAAFLKVPMKCGSTGFAGKTVPPSAHQSSLADHNRQD